MTAMTARLRGNTTTHYGLIARSFHWLTALLILAIIPLGVIAHDMPIETSEQLALKAELFRWHKTLGVVVFFVALARIIWAIAQPRPYPLYPERRLETLAAEVVHFMLYGSLVIVPLTGWIHHAATMGFAPLYLPVGDTLPFVPKDEGVASFFGSLHLTFEKVLIASLALHVAGALKHVVIDKDKTLARMCGTPELPSLAAPSHHVLPASLAVAVFASIFAGVVLFAPERTINVVPEALAEVTSDWQVQEGSIEIDVMQFGGLVTGSFADWTAAISFDPSAAGDVKGSADVTINIGSLTLGSVTSEALAPDFFAVEEFPTAQVTGDIVVADDAYVLLGSITIRGMEMPLALPFELALEGDKATASGTTQLQRLDFGVGGHMPDESTVGFAVEVRIELTALRAEG
ncbi:MAG: cytochrome b/b6 domain-containing protein [Pseudomonadota bacterium]